MFGYVLIPRTVLEGYERREQAHRDTERQQRDALQWLTRAVLELKREALPTAPATAGAPEPSAPVLSAAVRFACRQFAFGDPEQERVNLGVAEQLRAEGLDEKAIVARIEAGDQVHTFRLADRPADEEATS